MNGEPTALMLEYFAAAPIKNETGRAAMKEVRLRALTNHSESRKGVTQITAFARARAYLLFCTLAALSREAR